MDYWSDPVSLLLCSYVYLRLLKCISKTNKNTINNNVYATQILCVQERVLVGCSFLQSAHEVRNKCVKLPSRDWVYLTLRAGVRCFSDAHKTYLGIFFPTEYKTSASTPGAWSQKLIRLTTMFSVKPKTMQSMPSLENVFIKSEQRLFSSKGFSLGMQKTFFKCPWEAFPNASGLIYRAVAKVGFLKMCGFHIALLSSLKVTVNTSPLRFGLLLCVGSSEGALCLHPTWDEDKDGDQGKRLCFHLDC